jgi:hypothetical protein
MASPFSLNYIHLFNIPCRIIITLRIYTRNTYKNTMALVRIAEIRRVVLETEKLLEIEVNTVIH